MKLRSTPVVGLCLLGLVSIPAFADTSSSDQAETQLINKLSQQTQMLETQVAQLQGEIKKIKASQKTAHAAAATTPVAPVSSTTPTSAATNTTSAMAAVPGSTGSSVTIPANAEMQGYASAPNPYDPNKHFCAPVYLMSDKPLYLGGTPVVTSPYLGIDSQYNGGDLITILPYVNEDLGLLDQRQTLAQTYAKEGLPAPDHPFLELSGQIQALAYAQRAGGNRTTSDIDVSGAELDTAIGFNSWITGLMAFLYDNTPPSIEGGQGAVGTNSRIFLDRGFITIGNLEKTPVYATMGQVIVPFGVYSSNMIDNPFTMDMGRTKARAVELGYDQVVGPQEFKGAVYVFKGPTNTNDDTSTINNWGVNADYTYTQDKWNGDLGAGYLGNIADSNSAQGAGGFQNTAAPSSGFNGFGANPPNSGSEILVHRVPGIDVHGDLGIGNFSLVAEGVTAAQQFSPSDLSYNGGGAEPAALNAELAYKIPCIVKPTTVAIGFEQTKDALALWFPRQRYLAELNTSFWKDTIQSFEIRHDINYGESATASGQGVAVTTSGLGLGHTTNAALAQFTAYF